MKIVFVTQSEPFYIKHFYSSFFKAKPNVQVEGIVIQKTLNEQGMAGVIKKAFSFFGLKGFVPLGLKYVIIKASDVISRATEISFSASIEQIAMKQCVPILDFTSVNQKEFIDFIKNREIDLIVSVAASEIFKSEVINAPRLGCLNVHSSRLPLGRGMMPNFWTLYNKEEYAWVTVHKLNKMLDDGPIVVQDKFEIVPGQTYHSLAIRSKVFASGLLIRALELINSPEVQLIENDSSMATYHTFPTKEDIRLFKQMGGRII